MRATPSGPKKPKIYDYKRSWNYVLWLLGRKSYTKKQLRDKLVKKEASAEDIDKVIKRLDELKFVDDEAYAESYIRSRKARKGSLALKQELYQKGVPAELVEKTLEPLDTNAQLESAILILEKQAWRLQKTEPRKRYGKAYAFLARRGFPSDVVRAAVEQLSFDDDLD